MRPDHVSSTAQIFTSTRPASKPIRCTRSNERSVATPELFLGHAIHIIPCETSFCASLEKFCASSRSFNTKKRIMSSEFVMRFTNVAPSGSSPNSNSKSFGALTRPMREFSLIPSFFAKGVEEYPAIVRYHSRRIFHHVKPTKVHTVIVITDVIRPSHHHVRCVV